MKRRAFIQNAAIAGAACVAANRTTGQVGAGLAADHVVLFVAMADIGAKCLKIGRFEHPLPSAWITPDKTARSVATGGCARQRWRLSFRQCRALGGMTRPIAKP